MRKAVVTKIIHAIQKIVAGIIISATTAPQAALMSTLEMEIVMKCVRLNLATMILRTVEAAHLAVTRL
jgi:hypothetical protein